MLKYQWLGDFDEDMVHLTKENRIFDQRMADLLLMKAPEQTLAYYRHGLVFVFNFHFGNSLNNVLVPVRQPASTRWFCLPTTKSTAALETWQKRPTLPSVLTAGTTLNCTSPREPASC